MYGGSVIIANSIATISVIIKKGIIKAKKTIIVGIAIITATIKKTFFLNTNAIINDKASNMGVIMATGDNTMVDLSSSSRRLFHALNCIPATQSK